MEQTRTLYLKFKLVSGKTVTMTVPNPPAVLAGTFDEDTVLAAMQAIITANVFQISGSDIASVHSAWIVDETKTNLEVVVAEE